jgi:predicted 2-oxoglutarate/Fe(II)-dependent dioxygenase YbiX
MYSLIEIIDCLTKEELDTVNNEIDNSDFNFKNSRLIGSGKTKYTENTTVRSSKSYTLPENIPLTNILHEAINKSLLEYKNRLVKKHWRFDGYPVPGGISTSSYREGIQILQYSNGEKYGFHHDDSDDPNHKEYHRKISIVLYLKNAEEGGGTLFPHNTYKPNAGQVLIFPSNWCFPHSGEEVSSGIKRVAVTWYYANRNKS